MIWLQVLVIANLIFLTTDRLNVNNVMRHVSLVKQQHKHAHLVQIYITEFWMERNVIAKSNITMQILKSVKIAILNVLIVWLVRHNVLLVLNLKIEILRTNNVLARRDDLNIKVKMIANNVNTLAKTVLMKINFARVVMTQIPSDN